MCGKGVVEKIRISKIRVAICFEKQLLSGNRIHEINHNLPSGIYFIQVQMDNGIPLNEKLVIKTK